MTYVGIGADIKPKFSGHVWRDKYAGVHASVDLGPKTYLSFDAAADARTLAAECIKAAEAMEGFEAEPETPEGADR